MSVIVSVFWIVNRVESSTQCVSQSAPNLMLFKHLPSILKVNRKKKKSFKSTIYLYIFFSLRW